MTRLIVLCLLAVPLLWGSPSATAAPKSAAPAKTDALMVDEAGNRTGCESTGGTTKRCYVAGDSAELHVRISKDYPVLVTLDEAPKFMSKDSYLKHQKADTFVVFKLRTRPPKGHRVLLQTESMSLTLVFEAVATEGDSQVHILRSDRASVTRIVDQRVSEKTRELEAKHARDLDRLAKEAKDAARKELLEQLFEGGSHVGRPKGTTIHRHDFLVLRASRVTRIGNERFLRFTIEERKGAAFLIGELRASVSQQGAERSLSPDMRCESTAVRPGKSVSCVLALGRIPKRRGRALLSLTVDGAHGQRSVTLASIDIL